MTLRELRQERGYTQQALANLLEVNQAAISHWECGRSRPLRKYRRKIKQIFGEDAEYQEVNKEKGGINNGTG